MTFIDAIVAVLLISIFMFGFSEAFLPLYKAWNRATAEYNAARTLHFIAQSFRDECGKPDRNIDRWKRAVSIAKELEGYEITELKKGDEIYALKAVCIVSGERLEIIGLCTP